MSNIDRPKPGLRPLLTIDAQLPGITSVGTTPSGEIRLIPISGGTFEGEELRGEILSGGADWQDVRSDGVLEISARYLLRTVQGEVIEVRSVGLRAAPPEVAERIARGERVPGVVYYFRTAVRFRTASTRLARLNNVLAVSYGERGKDGVHLEVYEVL
jgi:hypothetical protein